MSAIQAYYDYTQKPWGQLFYHIVWAQLPRAQRCLDFGSGFGLTADHLAKGCEVVAIEPDAAMRAMRFHENEYTQLCGGLDVLADLPDESFDLVLCHNVLEYVDDQEAYAAALSRVVKPGGKLSLIKHNRAGRIMQKAVFENNSEQALLLVQGESSSSQSFGEIAYYTASDCERWRRTLGFRHMETLGLRTFFALHPDNSIRYDENWIASMFKLEMAASHTREFVDISFYNHIIMHK